MLFRSRHAQGQTRTSRGLLPPAMYPPLLRTTFLVLITLSLRGVSVPRRRSSPRHPQAFLHATSHLTPARPDPPEAPLLSFSLRGEPFRIWSATYSSGDHDAGAELRDSLEGGLELTGGGRRRMDPGSLRNGANQGRCFLRRKRRCGRSARG